MHILILLSGIFYSHSANASGYSHIDSNVYLWLALSLIITRGLSFIKKLGFPLVTSEILAGIILGNLSLCGITQFSSMTENPIIEFLANMGAIILMFEIGLSTDLIEIKKHLKSGINIALCGTLISFIGGFIVAKLLFTNLPTSGCLIIGMIACSTATGVSAKIFKELKITRTYEVKKALTTSIVGEIICVVIFAVISGVLMSGQVNVNQVGITVLKTIAFFTIAIIFGQYVIPLITQLSTRIHAGISMKIGIVFLICITFTWLASVFGIASVIGAFIAGAVINPIHFKGFSQSKFLRELKAQVAQVAEPCQRKNISQLIKKYENDNLDELIKPLSNLFVPIFFTYIGLSLKLEYLLNHMVIITALALLVTSYISWLIAAQISRAKLNKFVIGLGMTPIGEAGIIFAMVGQSLHLINDDIISTIVLALIITTFITPILLRFSIKKFGINYVGHK